MQAKNVIKYNKCHHLLPEMYTFLPSASLGRDKNRYIIPVSSHLRVWKLSAAFTRITRASVAHTRVPKGPFWGGRVLCGRDP
eukprot:1161396-Pelagomonas_calceolata.AAC.3